MSKPKRPMLRYYGGKWRLAEWIIGFFPPHRFYVEPFVGAGSVLLNKPRAYSEVINDKYGEVCNLFRVLRDPVTAELLARMVRLTPFSREDFMQSYEAAEEPVEQARRTLVRCFFGHGGHGSGGRKTGFRGYNCLSNTTPAQDWTGWPGEIPAFCERLRGVVVEQGDAMKLIERADKPDTLFYLDPPYLAEVRDRGRGVATKRYAFEMSKTQHVKLLRMVKKLKGMVIISGYASDLYDSMLKGWERRDLATLAEGARERVESVWFNDPVAKYVNSDMFAELQTT